MWRLLDCFKSERDVPQPASRCRSTPEAQHHGVRYRAPAAVRPLRSVGSSAASLEGSGALEARTRRSADSCDECGGRGDQHGVQRPGHLGELLSKPLLGKAPGSGPSTSSSAPATLPAGRVLEAAPPEPPSRPRSRAGGSGAASGCGSSSAVDGGGAASVGPSSIAFKEGWATKWPRPRSRLGLEELASGGSAVAQLLLAAEALGDEDEDNCCPTCLEAYTDGNPRVTTLCGHSYHLQCMYSWLDHGHTTCPYCEAPVDPDLL